MSQDKKIVLRDNKKQQIYLLEIEFQYFHLKNLRRIRKVLYLVCL